MRNSKNIEKNDVHLWLFHFERKMNSLELAKTVLQHYLPDELISFEKGEHGKPYLNNHPLQFNFSHSGDYFLMGVTKDRPIGVDIERLRDNKDFLAIAERFFAKSEYDALAALPVEQQQDAFYRCWVLKEAYIKATGFGLSLGLANFEVDFLSGVSKILDHPTPCIIPSSSMTSSLVSVSHDHATRLLCPIDIALSGYYAAICLEKQ